MSEPTDEWKDRMARLGQLTEPTQAELDALDGRLDPGVLQALRIVTQPSDAEVARVAAKLEERRAPREIPWAPGLALAAAGLLALVGWSYRLGPVDLPVGEAIAVRAPLSVGVATTVSGDGVARLVKADRGGTVVEVLDGELLFEVDPEARYRQVSVRSGALEVRVRGTRFAVSDVPAVEVEHGHVEVFRGDELVAELHAGEQWQLPAPVPVVVRKARAPRIEPPGWKPRATPPPAVHAVLSPPLERPEPVLVRAPTPRRPLPAKIGAGEAFQTVLSRADAGRDPGILAADWTIFLGGYPDAPGALRTEARARRLEAWLEVLPADEAVERIREFLAVEPDHPRRYELAYALGTLLRGDLRDCASALDAYALTAEGGGDLAARALVFTGVCELHEGRHDAARDAVVQARKLGVPDEVERYALRVERKAARPR